jgi:transposase-like protein
VKYGIMDIKKEKTMVLIEVKCPICQGTDISKNGMTKQEVQRYICNEKECSGKSFMIDYKYKGCKPGVEKQIIEMTANASGMRDISRVLKISRKKVSETLKKQKIL